MMELFGSPDPEKIAGIIASIIAVANVITSVTPSNSDNKVLSVILRVLNIVSINIGKNKNADDKT